MNVQAKNRRFIILVTLAALIVCSVPFMNQWESAGNKSLPDGRYLVEDGVKGKPHILLGKFDTAQQRYTSGKYEESLKIILEGVKVMEDSRGIIDSRVNLWEDNISNQEIAQIYQLAAFNLNNLMRYEEAMVYIQKAVKYDYDNKRIALNLIIIKLNKGDLAEAYTQLDDLIAEYHGDPELVGFKNQLIAQGQGSRIVFIPEQNGKTGFNFIK